MGKPYLAIYQFSNKVIRNTMLVVIAFVSSTDFFSSISVFPTERNVGDPQDVICIVASTSGLDDADSVIGSWTGPNGVITNDDRVTINTTIDNNIYTSILHFNYIMESDEGIYYCNVTTIDLDLNVSLTANITNLTSKLCILHGNSVSSYTYIYTVQITHNLNGQCVYVTQSSHV